MQYLSYFQFFTDMKKLVQDLILEFGTDYYKGLSDSEYDLKYRAMVLKLYETAQRYSCEWFFGPSKYVSGYLDAIIQTSEYPRHDRFQKLLEITDEHMRGSLLA